MVKVLLESKFIEINTQNKLGDTALIAASIKGRAEVVQALVTAGADTRLKNNAAEDAKLAANDPSGRYSMKTQIFMVFSYFNPTISNGTSKNRT